MSNYEYVLKDDTQHIPLTQHILIKKLFQVSKEQRWIILEFLISGQK